MPFCFHARVDGKGAWIKFGAADAELLEKHYQGGETTFETKAMSFANSSTAYSYDFEEMIQRNEKTGNLRSLRRCDSTTGTVKSDSDDGGYARLIRTKSSDWKVSGEDAEADTDDSKSSRSKGTRSSTRTKAKGKSKAKADVDEEKEEEEESKESKKPAKKKRGRKKKEDDEEEKGESKEVKYRGVGKLPDPLSLDEIKKQAALGAQSRRNQKRDYGTMVYRDAHGRHCFDKMLENEARLCGEWAVFYHSYSYAALLYEVQSAVAAGLLSFSSDAAQLRLACA